MTAQYRQAVMKADHPVTVCQNLLPHSHENNLRFTSVHTCQQWRNRGRCM